MNRQILLCALFAASAVAIAAQAAAQSSPYSGTSRPPSDDQITTSSPPEAKPPAGHPIDSQANEPAPSQDGMQPPPASSPDSQVAPPSQSGTYDGGVHSSESPQPMSARAYPDDPDGDMVHPHSHRPGEILEGTTIRVRLLQRLSTSSTEKGEYFHTMVASDVLQDGRVVIPAGAEIDGQVVNVSTGHLAGHGSMRLSPETVTMPDGTHYRLHADVTSTPGSRTRVGGEGSITPGSQLKRDGIEYGGAVGAGLVTGAIVGGPAGAAAGSLIGAGVITVHLLVNHPQATLEQGTNMMLTLTEPLDLVPAMPSGN